MNQKTITATTLKLTFVRMAFAVTEKGNPMDDLIRRQDVIDYVLEHGFYCDTEADKEYTAELIRTVFPSAQKKGQWVYDAEAYPLGNPYGHYDCDQCGESVPHKTNFCPNCGADMREETDEC